MSRLTEILERLWDSAYDSAGTRRKSIGVSQAEAEIRGLIPKKKIENQFDDEWCQGDTSGFNSCLAQVIQNLFGGETK